jgi:15-hydroxyprostaglandin dehydrogenase (NAD)
MSFSVAGRTALLTGAASGLGKGFSHRLLKEGAGTLLCLDMNEQLLHTQCEEMQVKYQSATIVPIVCDVTDLDALAKAFATKTDVPLSIVANNAGIGDEEKWQMSLALNLNAAIAGTQLGIESFQTNKPEGGGVIVNVASMAGLFPVPFGPVYTAGKHGLVGYSRCFQHMARKGIRVNCLCPAFVDTPLVQGMLGSKDKKIAMAGKFAVESTGGLIPIEMVEDAFYRLIIDSAHNGSVMRVTNGQGAQLHNFPTDGMEGL